MNDRPLESWVRDQLFANPWPTIGAVCEGLGIENIPTQVKRYCEFPTDAGPADLVLLWSGNAIVVEVKRDIADEGAVAQCLRYIGALHAEIPVRVVGAVAAPGFTRNAVYAAHSIKVVLLRTALNVNVELDYDLPDIRPAGPARAQLVGEAMIACFPELRDLESVSTALTGDKPSVLSEAT